MLFHTMIVSHILIKRTYAMGGYNQMIVHNPIIKGFYPDPSICRAGEKYYLVCSSFEYFPGVPLFESEDLLNWKQIGHCLTRKSQVDLECINSSGGVFAPTIRYYKGTFYMVTTNDTYHKNFYVYTDDIYGEWSEPIFVDQGGIDPSLYFEGDKAYFMSNGTDEDGLGCIYQCEIDIKTGKKQTESIPIWKGSGGRYLESPHLYHFGEWYYLTAAEGGTEYGHMITYARGKTPYGPFESYPQNPVLTNRNLGGNQNQIQGIGHGDLIQDENGNTFIVCLGFRQEGMWVPYHHLGREVFLVPVTWREDGWFEAGIGGIVKEEMEMPIVPRKGIEPMDYSVSFQTVKKDSPRWCYLRKYRKECYEFLENGLCIYGTPITLDDVDAPAFIGIRQSEFTTHLKVDVETEAEEAGVTFYLSEAHHYDLAVRKEGEQKSVILRFCIGDAKAVVNKLELPFGQEKITLKVDSEPTKYYFRTTMGGKEILLGEAQAKYLSSEVAGGFTGVVMGLYVMDSSDTQKRGCFTDLEWMQ